jgi:hypothetical protein
MNPLVSHAPNDNMEPMTTDAAEHAAAESEAADIGFDRLRSAGSPTNLDMPPGQQN